MALSNYVRTVAYCEIDTYCQAVLLSRMADGSIDRAPIWDNITTLEGRNIGEPIDIVFGGFPCQDISVAGLGKGLAGERSGLFYEIVRLCREIVPKWIFLENVPAVTTRGGTEVVREITKMGYDCRWCVISAASVGALHKRERWFLLANSKHDGTSPSEGRRSIGESIAPGGQQQQKESVGKIERAGGISTDVAYTKSSDDISFKRQSMCGQIQQSGISFKSSDVADPECKRLEGQRDRTIRTSEKESMPAGCGDDGNTDSIASKQADTCAESEQSERRAWGRPTGQYWPFESREHWQEVVSGVCRTSDGVSCHVERLRALGNSVVPIQARQAFEILAGIKR